ncbi:MAG: DUF1538 domain-containing protein [Oscillospiraceae bacterium]|nr:DUF1538 domain-containing protein [Oscillospiraceae bacterium]
MKKMEHVNNLSNKIREAVTSILPVLLLVLAICFTAVPVSPDIMLSFIIGAVLLIGGMGLFTMGADIAMTPIGSHIGTKITKTKKLWVILLLSFVLGVMITVSEPDLQVLATNVPHIDTAVLIITVACGVGFFLAVSMLRILFGVQLKWLLIGFYTLVFIFSFLSDANFLSVAFDSGGVTTGPMTVPFIMAMGVGVANVRSDKKAEEDSFGLVALSSIGPIVAVLALGFINSGSSESAGAAVVSSYTDTAEIGLSYLSALPKYMWEVLSALAPIALFFLIFQFAALRLERHLVQRILIGIIYTYFGLVLFLTGVNVGFSPLGAILGGELTLGWRRYLLIPLGMLMGWFVISAEPAVHVLNKQVEEISSGAISAKAMGLSLSVAISAAVGLAMLRVLTSIPILWFLLPGYLAALVLSFFVPPIFTAIAFDSGGVASGPMAATFLLPLAVGASSALGGNVLTDAFGLVAMVAMMPLITIQIMGMIYVYKSGKAELAAAVGQYDELAVIELWEAI